jgi:hypothetical protein
MKRIHPIILVPAFALLVACQSTGGDRTVQSQPTVQPAAVPPGVKERAAAHVLNDYMKDSLGPPTVSRINSGTNFLGTRHGFEIRYPVLGRPGLFDSERPKVIRCIFVTVKPGAGADSGYSMTFKRPEAGEKCFGPTEGYSPYVELERMAAKVRKCNVSGEEKCLLTTNMPEAAARRLMNDSR